MVSVVGLAGVLVLTGCSGSGSASDAEAAASSDFCSKAQELQTTAVSNDSAAVGAALASLASLAPSEELRSAIGTVASGLSAVSGGQKQISDLLAETEFASAATALSAYGLKECGISLALTPNDPGSSTTESTAPSVASLLDGVPIGQAVDAYLSANAPQYRIARVLVSEVDAIAAITLSLTGSGALDAGAVCNVIDGVVAQQTSSTAYTVSVTLDGSDKRLAGHDAGQPCAAA